MPVEDYTPTTEDVAALLPARTRDRWGNVGEFTDRTRPTAEQVDSIIARAVALFAPRVGDIREPCISHIENVKGIIALRAAMLVELTYFPEQVNSGQSPYRQHKDLYDEAKVEVLDALEDCRSDTDPTDGSNAGPGGYPLGNFDTCTEMIGLRTEF